MKFDKLFRNVFITEQDELPAPTTDDTDLTTDTTSEAPSPDENNGVPVPDNYDVEPAPISSPTGDSGSVKEFISKIESFAEELNGVDGNSLQQIVNDLDRPGSLFQGISRETSSDIIKLAEQAVRLSEILKGFIISSAKRQRDIAAGQSVNR